MNMTLPVGLMNIFVLKDRVRENFADGLDGFRKTFPYCGDDDYLFKLGAMSGGDLQELVDDLARAGLDPEKDLAIAEGMHGPWQHSEGIAFRAEGDPDAYFRPWFAYAEKENNCDCTTALEDQP